jgi:GlpG protein
VFILQNLLGDQPVMIWPGPTILRCSLKSGAISAMLSCISLMHILFNLLWWWYLGGAVEKRIGSGKLVVITVISALLSGFVQHSLAARGLAAYRAWSMR